MDQYGISWPVVVIDFEASSLGDDSYPIEIAVGIWAGPKLPVKIWSDLIEPCKAWVEQGIWLLEAQNIHGITPQSLIGAPKPDQIVNSLKKTLEGKRNIISDNPYWENLWMQKLVTASGIKDLNVDFYHLRNHLSKLREQILENMIQYAKDNPSPHRAAKDVEHIMLMIAHGLKLNPEIHHEKLVK